MCGGWLWQPGASFSQNTRGWRSWEGEASIALLWKSPAGTSRVLRDLRSQVTRSVALHVNAHCISLQKSQQRSSAHHGPLKDPVPQSSCYVFGFIVPIAEITVTRKLPLRKKPEFQNKAEKTSVCSVCGFFFSFPFYSFHLRPRLISVLLRERQSQGWALIESEVLVWAFELILHFKNKDSKNPTWYGYSPGQEQKTFRLEGKYFMFFHVPPALERKGPSRRGTSKAEQLAAPAVFWRTSVLFTSFYSTMKWSFSRVINAGRKFILAINA